MEVALEAAATFDFEHDCDGDADESGQCISLSESNCVLNNAESRGRRTAVSSDAASGPRSLEIEDRNESAGRDSAQDSSETSSRKTSSGAEISEVGGGRISSCCDSADASSGDAALDDKTSGDRSGAGAGSSPEIFVAAGSGEVDADEICVGCDCTASGGAAGAGIATDISEDAGELRRTFPEGTKLAKSSGRCWMRRCGRCGGCVLGTENLRFMMDLLRPLRPARSVKVPGSSRRTASAVPPRAITTQLT